MRKDTTLFVNTFREDLKKAFCKYKEIHTRQQERLKFVQLRRAKQKEEKDEEEESAIALKQNHQNQEGFEVSRAIDVEEEKHIIDEADFAESKDNQIENSVVLESKDVINEDMDTKGLTSETAVKREISAVEKQKESNPTPAISSLDVMEPPISTPHVFKPVRLFVDLPTHLPVDYNFCHQCEQLAKGHLLLSQQDFYELYNCFKPTHQLMKETNDLGKRHEYRFHHAKQIAEIEKEFDLLFGEEQKEQFADLVEAIVPVAPKPPRSEKLKGRRVKEVPATPAHAPGTQHDGHDIEKGEAPPKGIPFTPHILTTRTVEDEERSYKLSSPKASTLDFTIKRYGPSKDHTGNIGDEHGHGADDDDYDSVEDDYEQRAKRTGIVISEVMSMDGLLPHAVIVEEKASKGGAVIQRPRLHGSSLGKIPSSVAIASSSTTGKDNSGNNSDTVDTKKRKKFVIL